MSNFSNKKLTRAQREVKHRREAYKYGRKTNYNSDSDFEENRKTYIKRFSHYVLSTYIFTGLILILYSFSLTSYKISTGAYRLNNIELGKIEVPKSNSLYQLDFHQKMGIASPKYSELEIEILNSDYSHYYSIYKDLWVERHSDGDGGSQNYRDETISFEVIFKEEGSYYYRAISHNGFSLSPVKSQLYGKSFGRLFLPQLSIFFGIISIILLIANSVIGTPIEMYNQVVNNTSKLNIKLYYSYILTLLFILVMVIVCNLFYVGYPSGGEVPTIPAKLLQDKTIYYKG